MFTLYRAKANPSTAWSLGQNSGCSMSAPYLDPAVAREIFGPPRGILAWGPDIPRRHPAGQGRPVHFETVGRILLGLPPEGRMFR